MRALIIVDVQRDFCPGGALAVPQGDEVLEPIARVRSQYDLVVATQDWHPADHGSFAANHPGTAPGQVIELDGLEQILWPTHCVQNTPGAAFHDDLELDGVARVFQKGTNPRVDSYSGFHDNARRGDTGLAEYLKSQGVADVAVVGLATDYCVKFTALDARSHGFETSLIVDACRGVDLQPGDVDRALADLQAAGVDLVESRELTK